MRRNLEPIEIQDPPIQELGKKHSCLKRTCATGCGCIVIFIIGLLLLLKFSTGPQTEKIGSRLPPDFPDSIPIYSPDDISAINFISGKEPGKVRKTLGSMSKILLYPALMTLENRQTASPKEIFNRQNFRDYLQQPKNDGRDTYTIEWRDLPASPNFIGPNCLNELKNKGYSTTSTNNNENNFSFTFAKDKISGELTLTDTDNKKPTDYLKMTIKMPAE